MNPSDLIQQVFDEDQICRYTALVENDELQGDGLRTIVWCEIGGEVKVRVTAEGWVRDITKMRIEEKLQSESDSVAVSGSGSLDDPITFKNLAE